MKNISLFQSGSISNSFPEGWHDVICNDAHVSAVKYMCKHIILYDFDFTDLKTNDTFWVQILYHKNDEVSNIELSILLEALFNMDIKQISKENRYVKDCINKKCRVLTESRTNPQETKIIIFTPIK